MRSLFGVSLFSLFVDHRACICIGDRCIDRLAGARAGRGRAHTDSQSVRHSEGHSSNIWRLCFLGTLDVCTDSHYIMMLYDVVVRRIQ